MNYTLAKALPPGSTIGVVAPSSTIGDYKVEPNVAILESMGYKVKLGKSAQASWGYLAGDDALRAADLQAAFLDDEIDGIVCLRGGYGATRILPFLNYEAIAAHPKVFVGFSDITALHTMFLQRCHMATIHGPMVMSLQKASDYTKEYLARGLADPFAAGPVLLPPEGRLETIVPGDVTGTLCGGNLMLLAVTEGTPYSLDIENMILLIEETSEPVYSLDRLLCQLEQSGLIRRAKGIIFGEFTRCEPVEPAPYEFTVQDIIYQYARKWGKPAICGFPAGHGADNLWLPLGRPVRLHCTDTAADVEIL